MAQRALVAGGAGFVGSHLTDELIRRGYEVVVVDTLLTGSRSNIEHLAEHPQFAFVHGDAADAITLVDGPFDLVMHFASPASPPWYMKYPIETLHAGSNATEGLLRVAQRDDARFILASTSEVYGDPSVHPQPESYWGNVNPNGPRSVYDEAKRYAEAITAAFRRSHRVNTGIVRIFNTYGPRMDIRDGRMIPAFAAAALKNDPIPLHGSGTQTRSLTYVGDLVRGILALADSDQPGPINIGNPREQTVREIAELIISLIGSSSTISLQPRPVDDPERRRPDISLARELLDWEPEVDAETGLAETVEWFRTHTTS
jgi:dTDP-glucose 4,6-dehydratase